jgi:hypothetical protein
MSNPDDSGLTFTIDGSRLLSEPSLMASESNSSRTEIMHADLSLSDLSLRDRDGIMSKPFSLLSGPEPTTPPQQMGELGEVEEEGAVEEIDEEALKRQNAKAREEKLQSDVFMLKKLNASFAAFNEALDATGSVNDVGVFTFCYHASWLSTPHFDGRKSLNNWHKRMLYSTNMWKFCIDQKMLPN